MSKRAASSSGGAGAGGSASLLGAEWSLFFYDPDSMEFEGCARGQ